MPQNVLQTLKKQCNPLLKKSFKERNPDVDMDEIQNNPNVPEDVKAAITGALTLTLDDDGTEGGETAEEDLPPIEGLETFDDDYIMDMSEDDGKRSRRRRVDENDEDWLTGRRKGGKPKRSKRKKKHSKKHRSENGENTKQTNGDGNGGGSVGNDKEKIKKKRSRKSNDTTTKPTMDTSTLNGSSALENTIGSSALNNSTVNSTNTSFSGYEQLNSSHELTNGLSMIDSSGYDSMRAKPTEQKQKKTPKKRDSMDKSVNGIVKKTSRRQFTSISAIMACIESVVQGTDVSIPESNESEIAIKTEPIENNDTFKVPTEPMASMDASSIKVEAVKFENDMHNVIEPKKKQRRRSSTTKKAKSKETPAATGKSADQIVFDSKPIIKKPPLNGAPAKPSRTSMKKVKFLS